MIQFRTFITNNARRWEHGARDHLACAAALLLAAGADEAPTNAKDLQTLRQQVHGLSTNDAFRKGQLAMQLSVHAAVDEVANSPESLDRHAFARKLRRALEREFDSLVRSARFAQDAKVLPSETSMEKENSRLRAELAKAQSQLASLVRSNANPPTEVGPMVLCRDSLNDLLVYASSRLDRTLAHGIQGGNFLTAFRLTHELVDRLISRVKNQEQELDSARLEVTAQQVAAERLQSNHRASLAALDKHRVELQAVLNETRGPGEPAVNADTMAQAVDLVGDRLHELRSDGNEHARGVIDANTHTAKKLKQELAKISGFDVSSIPDYDPAKPGAVTTAVVEAVRTYGSKRYSVGCKDAHEVVDGWLIGLLKSIGCGEVELADVVAETKREGNGDAAFKVARTVILRRVLRMLMRIANDSMPVGLPRPWTLAMPSPAAIESAAAALVDEIQSRTAERPRTTEPLNETKLRVLAKRIRGHNAAWLSLSEVQTLLQHLGLWRD